MVAVIFLSAIGRAAQMICHWTPAFGTQAQLELLYNKRFTLRRLAKHCRHQPSADPTAPCAMATSSARFGEIHSGSRRETAAISGIVVDIYSRHAPVLYYGCFIRQTVGERLASRIQCLKAARLECHAIFVHRAAQHIRIFTERR